MEFRAFVVLQIQMVLVEFMHFSARVLLDRFNTFGTEGFNQFIY